MTQKIEIFGKQFAHDCVLRESFLTNLRGQKSRFLDFCKVVWELFRKCLGIVFSLNRSTFSPLGSRKALKDVDTASPGLFISYSEYMKCFSI